MINFGDITRAIGEVKKRGATPDVIEITIADASNMTSSPFFPHDGLTMVSLMGVPVRFSDKRRVGYFTKEALGALSPDSWYIRNYGEHRRSWVGVPA